ncbi:MAG: hypothetical protein WAN03_11440 [Candidatus Sulfotelmatobacter sp.]
MKKLALLLGLAATFTWAQDARPAQANPAAAKFPHHAVLQQQMQLDNINAEVLKASFYAQGMFEGAISGAGGTLLIVGVALQIRKKKQPTGDQQILSRAASA